MARRCLSNRLFSNHGSIAEIGFLAYSRVTGKCATNNATIAKSANSRLIHVGIGAYRVVS